VLELSSFQLHYSEDFAPTVATVLNLSQDHLDWHTDMADYAHAKARIFGPDTLMVLNREDATVMSMLPAPVRIKLQKPQERAHICFGADQPQRAGDYGLQDLGAMLWLVRAAPADETLKGKRAGGVQEDLFLQKLMPADALRIHGRHNACNALAALALASAVGCTLGPMLFGLREYRGEPHRMQSLGTVAEVEYFDDSKGTNVGATLAALHGLGVQMRLVLILGGQGKGQDFRPLAHPVARYARAVLVIGADAPALRAALASSQVPLHDAQSLQEAVAQAAALAQAGDAVLLSPACASLDMFRDYSHRAQVFADAVAALAADAGTVLEAFA
jgi:UDP-N-acetylmuramoylalanine--D-glutamate ligase